MQLGAAVWQVGILSACARHLTRVQIWGPRALIWGPKERWEGPAVAQVALTRPRFFLL